MKMRYLVLTLLFFPLASQADAGFYKLDRNSQLLSIADEIPHPIKKKGFKFTEYEKKERDLSTEKTSLEEFSNNQTTPVSLSEIGRSSRFTNYVSGNSVEIGIEYPLNFGVHLKSRINGDFYLRFGSGFVTEFFLGSFAKLAPNLGYVNEHEALLISEAFKNSLYGDLRLGWSPYYKKHAGGPYIEVGASGFFFGKGEVSGFTFGKAINTDGELSDSKYSTRPKSYAANLHLGYQIPIEKHININIEVGAIKIFDIKLNPTTSPNAAALPEKYHQEFIDFIIQKGWIFPTFSAWVAFSF